MKHFLVFNILIIILIGCVSHKEVMNEKPAKSIMDGDSIYYPGYEKVVDAWADSLKVFRTIYEVNGHYIDGDGRRYDSTDIPENVVPVDKGPIPTDLKVASYPAEAKEKKINGRVLVKIWIDDYGRPLFAKILESSNSIFNESALIAGISSRFEPAILNNRGVGVWAVIPFNYRITK